MKQQFRRSMWCHVVLIGALILIACAQITKGQNAFPTPSGNVGIGTTSPDAKVHVTGLGYDSAALGDDNSRDNLIFVDQNSNVTTGAGGGILFGAEGKRFALIKGYYANGGNNGIGDLTFATRAATTDSALTEQMRLTSWGFFGIGTSNPAAKLHLNGGGVLVGTTGAGSSQRTLTVLNSGQTQINYGSYPYDWSPALQLQNNDNTKFLWLSAGGSGSYSNFNARIYAKGEIG